MSYKDEILFENEWLTLKKRVKLPHCPGYVFSHHTNCKGRVVAVLPHRKNKGLTEYLLRREVIPSWGFNPSLSFVTGRCIEGIPPHETAVIELKEETGYDVPFDYGKTKNCRWSSLGVSHEAKSSDTLVYLFAVDLSGLEPGEILGDGSYYDKNGEGVWSRKPWESEDPLVSIVWARLRALAEG